MTKEYAASMWKHYLNAMRKERKESIFLNPVYRAVKEKRFDDLSPEEKTDFLDESQFHFKYKEKATVQTLILRALGEIIQDEEGSQSLISLLAEISADSYGKD